MNRKRRFAPWILGILAALLAAFGVVTLLENRTVGATHYTISSQRLPAQFDGYKIAQISDFHNAVFGKENDQILALLREEQPDLIAFTGDLVDSNHTDLEVAAEFVAQAAKIAPCYYVTGNHEARLGEAYWTLEKQLTDAGVTVLHDEVVDLWKGEGQIQVIGLDDPEFTDRDPSIQTGILETKLASMELQDGFRLLLSHRPEAFAAYVAQDMDLVLSGHAHGGQVRLPLIGGIIAPHQGLFPQYDGGVYSAENTVMVVSRGIGNSTFPLRVNNPPEVVVVQLRAE